MPILITGGSGKLGKALKKVFKEAITPSHKTLDITNRHQVKTVLAELKPNIIIHAAAATGIRQCEDNQTLAWKTNVIGTKNLVEAIKETSLHTYFIYISTACVFSGDKEIFTEEDLPYPKNYYALTKLLGEFTISESNLKKFLIVRTNFVAKETWPYKQAFIDRFGTYLFADDVAKGLKDMIEKNTEGIIHLCGDKKLSMYDLAKLVSPNIQPITLKDYQGPPLTINMCLDSIRWKKYKISKN